MFCFGKKRKQMEERKAAEFRAIHNDTVERINKAADKIETYSIDKLLEKEDIGVTELIFLATGGANRIDRKHK